MPQKLFLMLCCLAILTVLGTSCSDAVKAVDNFNSRLVCQNYCDKKFACAEQSPSSDQSSDCVSACRDAIENKCGNENQAAANDKIAECVDKNCVEFTACMVFSAAPECFGFTSSN